MARTAALALVAAVALVACSNGTTGSSTSSAGSNGAAPATARASAGHVFVIVLENTDYSEAFGTDTPMPYLAHELAAKGALLTRYYGIGHHSLDNYLAMISGQAPNPATQADCPVFSEFHQTGTGAGGQALGRGCVYPAPVRTIADQLQAAGLTWRAYAQDMAAGAPNTCRHPAVGANDTTSAARAGDDYATRHVPFLYFHSIIDSPDCGQHVVDLSALTPDLTSAAATPNLAFIVPGLCDDGHDAVCADGSTGGPARADAWLRQWVPTLLASPAMTAGGQLIITFDEADTSTASVDASACCGARPGPNLEGPAGITGPGGGRIGAVVIGFHVAPGTTTATPYDHYSLLCSLERLWGLQLLGLAGHGSTSCFGPDVYTAGGPPMNT